MRLFLSRTVTKRLTRLTWVLITWAGCAGANGSAGAASVHATIAVTHCVTTFWRERMYTFLDAEMPGRKRPRGGMPPCRMPRNHARDAWLKPPERIVPLRSLARGL